VPGSDALLRSLSPDYAPHSGGRRRRRVSAKRGGDAPPLDHSEAVNLDEIAGNISQKSSEVLALDQALDELPRVGAQAATTFGSFCLVGLPPPASVHLFPA
jgi:hypothetical protein